jgi:hypothetical protein
MSSYDESTWVYAKSILKYLKGTTHYGIVYNVEGSQYPKYGEGITMSAQVDSDWGGKIEDSKSTTGMTISLNGVCIYAQSKIQSRPALSTAESETNGSEQLVRNVEWYRHFLSELQIQLREATPVSQDNTTTLRLTEDCIMQARTKYYRITQHYLRFMVASEIVKFEYKASKSMWCDALNKGISYPQFTMHIEPMMGLQKRKIQEVLMVARTKNCYRRGPSKKFVTKVQQRKDSRSSHPSPLEAKCLECQDYRQWNLKMNGWIACKVGCTEEKIEVKCTKCLTNANLNRKLDQWNCMCPEVKEIRSRKAPNRFMDK